MKNIKFLVLGIFFAIVLSKVQAISWFRFYEMFKFQSFHMFGIIGGAIVVSSVIMQLFKRGVIKDINGNKIIPKSKKKYKLFLGFDFTKCLNFNLFTCLELLGVQLLSLL